MTHLYHEIQCAYLKDVTETGGGGRGVVEDSPKHIIKRKNAESEQ